VLPMTILLATDVFGATPAVTSLVRALRKQCLVVSPFDDAELYFQAEQTAYYAFLAQGGVSRYAEKLKNILQQQGEEIQMAIGFSAGASALWIASADEAAAQLQAAVLFYGSRIRDHKQVKPICPVRLIFAENEAAFNASELSAELRQLGHHAELVRDTSHGFMNPYSRGFDVKIQTTYLDQLTVLAHRHCMANPVEELGCAWNESSKMNQLSLG
jgi:dienelactone hydrolase